MSNQYNSPTPRELEVGSKFAETTQARYANKLFAHTNTIPTFAASSYPRDEAAVFMGNYCRGKPFNPSVIEKGETPLYRDDIVDPNFTKSVLDLISTITGEDQYHHWYAPVGRERPYASSWHISNSRRLEMAYVSYMHQRRLFHATFISSLMQSDPTTSFASPIENITRVQLPPLHGDDIGEIIAPDLMYNTTNWAASSLFSALLLPPEKCSAGMKRHAIELFTALAKPSDLKSKQPIPLRPTAGFYDIAKLADENGFVRLPQSMQITTQEPQSSVHPQWHENEIYQQYFGESIYDEPPNALATFLRARPKDYIQILLLRAFRPHGDTAQILEEIMSTAQLSPEIKDVLFAEDTSFNTILEGRGFGTQELRGN